MRFVIVVSTSAVQSTAWNDFCGNDLLCIHSDLKLCSFILWLLRSLLPTFRVIYASLLPYVTGLALGAWGAGFLIKIHICCYVGGSRTRACCGC